MLQDRPYIPPTARAYVEALEQTLKDLVQLKDGPRDNRYRAAKDDAWDRARALVNTTSERNNDD